MEHNPENIKATYELGVKDAENAINALIEWLK
jgi:hypothetical protein